MTTLSNFRDLKKISFISYAMVDVEEGFFFWKKKTTRTIFKEGVFWRFLDTGEFTPLATAEKLEAVYKAQKCLTNY